MLLWHLGTAALIVYVTLGRRRIDYRFVLAGAALPDLVDGAAILLGAHFPAGRGVAHSLLACLGVAGVILIATRGERRLRAFGIFVGWLAHLVADGMWASPRTFLWPAFGTAFDVLPVEPYAWDVLARPWAHPWTWLGEMAGIAILWWFWVAFELGQKGRRRRFVRDGYLRA